MDLGESLFSLCSNSFKRWSKKAPSVHCCYFVSIEQRLKYLASTLLEKDIHVIPAQRGWGWIDHALIVPDLIDCFASWERNYDVYKARLLVDIHLLQNYRQQTSQHSPWALTPLRLPELQKTWSSLDIERFVLDLCSGFESLSLPHQERYLHFRSPDIKIAEGHLKDEDLPLHLEQVCEAKETVHIKQSEVSRTEFLHLNSDDMLPLSHVFEKIKTADEYQGGVKQFDLEDELKDHAPALQGLHLHKAIRVDTPGGGQLSGITVLDHSQDLQSSRKELVRYREWSDKKTAYLPSWCTVQVIKDSLSSHVYEPLPEELLKPGTLLRQRLLSCLNDDAWVHRQEDGPDLDLSAYIDTHGDRLRHVSVDERIYMNKHKQNLDFELTFLCDGSLSTASWIQTYQVIQLIQDGIGMLSYALRELPQLWSLAAFSSHTRHECVYQVLKDFDESASLAWQRGRLLTPRGYTRIGPALRHSAAVMNQRPKKRRRGIILVSDGKPTDYDSYGGSYGVADVKKAISELESSGIKFFSILLIPREQKHDWQRLHQNVQLCSTSMELAQGLMDISARFLKSG